MSLRNPLVWWAVGLLLFVPGTMSLSRGDAQGFWYGGLSAPCFAAMYWRPRHSSGRVR